MIPCQNVSFTSDFSEWSNNDDHLQELYLRNIQDPRVFSRHTLQSLRNIGFASDALACLYSQLPTMSQEGAARFTKIRVLTWYWDNGDQIVFPVNSRNQIYLGNDSYEWVPYWPFLSSTGDDNLTFRLHKLSTHRFNLKSTAPSLLICGQKHFGHFVVNQLLSLYSSIKDNPLISNRNPILHPEGYTDIHWNLLGIYSGLSSASSQQLPCNSGIYEIENVIVPAIPVSPFLLSDQRGMLESSMQNRSVSNGKYIYVTRGSADSNDRIYGYSRFLETIKKLGFSVLNPTELGVLQRIQALGDAEVILSDSGSCWLNGLMFSNQHTKILNIIPKSVLSSNDILVVGQLVMNLGLFVEGLMLPLDVTDHQQNRQSNCWYDLCIPPTADDLLHRVNL